MHWWTEPRPSSAGCGTWRIPGRVLAGEIEIERGLQNSTCQHQCPFARIGSPFGHLGCWAGGLICPLASLGHSPGSAGGSDPGSFQMTASVPVPRPRAVLHAPESLFPTALRLSPTQAPLTYKARHSGGLSAWCRTPRLGSLTWDSDPSLLGQNLCSCE